MPSIDLESIPQVTHDYEFHARILFELVLTLKAKEVLELGTDVGDSARIFLEALKITGGNLTTIDILPPKWNREVMKFYSNFTFHEIDSLSFQPDKYYDLIFIDDHGPEEPDIEKHVTLELEKYFPFLSAKGVIAVHDTNHSIFGGGIRKAVEEFIRGKNLLATFDKKGHGLSLLRSL
jgi:predicted O-methyltransferase YrrM